MLLVEDAHLSVYVMAEIIWIMHYVNTIFEEHLLSEVLFSFCPLVLEDVLCTSDNDVPCHPSTIPLMGGVYCLSRLRSQAGDHLPWTRRHDVSGFEDVQTAQSSKGGWGGSDHTQTISL